MKVYLDADFIVHADNADGYIEAEDSFFDYICPEIYDCYRLVPEGYSWTRGDGKVFNGKAISLVNPSNEATLKQREYERQLLSDMQAALESSAATVEQLETEMLAELDAAYMEGVNSV